MAALTAVSLVWLTVSVIAGSTASFDDEVRSFIHRSASPWLTRAMLTFTLIGSQLVLWPLVFLAVFAFWRGRRVHDALLLAVAMAGAQAIEIGLKQVFRRP